MWNIDIYSIGDTSGNDYLRVYEKSFTGSVMPNKYSARFTDIETINNRVWELKQVLERAKNEIDLLEKYNDKLIGCTDWLQVQEK